MFVIIAVVLCLAISVTLSYVLECKALKAERYVQQALDVQAELTGYGKILSPDQVIYPVPRKTLFRHKHKPTLAELEAKSRQMEEEALLTPESVWADNEKWIQETDRILNPPPSITGLFTADSLVNCPTCGSGSITCSDHIWKCGNCGCKVSELNYDATAKTTVVYAMPGERVIPTSKPKSVYESIERLTGHENCYLCDHPELP